MKTGYRAHRRKIQPRRWDGADPGNHREPFDTHWAQARRGSFSMGGSATRADVKMRHVTWGALQSFDFPRILNYITQIREPFRELRIVNARFGQYGKRAFSFRPVDDGQAAFESACGCADPAR